MVPALEFSTSKSKELHGVPAVFKQKDGVRAEYYITDPSHREDFPAFYTPQNSLSGRVSHNSSRTFSDYQITTGCRAIEYRLALFQSQISHKTSDNQHPAIGISTVRIGGQSFISGFRSLVDCRLGYSFLPTEEHVCIPRHARIEGIEVSFCSAGLVGVRFLFSGNHASRWVGQIDVPGAARGIIPLPRSDNEHFLIVGLDVSLFFPHLTFTILNLLAFQNSVACDRSTTPEPSRH